MTTTALSCGGRGGLDATDWECTVKTGLGRLDLVAEQGGGGGGQAVHAFVRALEGLQHGRRGLADAGQ